MAESTLTAARSGSPSSRRTQSERRDATRSALVASAIGAVNERGPGASIGEIAERAGVSKGALQHHFDSKGDLLVAIVTVGWHDLAERLERSIDADRPVGERLALLVDTMWESYRRPSTLAAFVISSDRSLDDETARRVGDVFVEARDRLDAIWRSWFADTEVSSDLIDLSRRFARDHLAGLLVQRQIGRGDEPSDQSLDALHIALANLLGVDHVGVGR